MMKSKSVPSKASHIDSFFFRRLVETIDAYNMICSGDSVLVGLSGGADSMALLHGLVCIADRYNCRIGVAHVDHGLRGEASERDARFAAKTAKDLNLPYHEKRIDPEYWQSGADSNIEEKARIIRYQFFNETADRFRYGKIALGHQREDAAEQILLNLLRGSGPDGLGGLAPVRGTIIRPLIHTSRRQIEAFLACRGLSYQLDETNQDDRFMRNRIRNQLLPELARYNPRIVDTLNRLGDVMRSDAEWIDQLIEPVFNDAVLTRGKDYLTLSIESTAGVHRAAKRRIVRKAIQEIKGDLRRIGYIHVEDVLALFESEELHNPLSQIHLPGRIRVVRENRRLTFCKEKKSLRSSFLSGKKLKSISFDYKMNCPPSSEQAIRLEEIGAWMIFERIETDGKKANRFPDGQQMALMDGDLVKFPLTIRNMRPGDRFTPLGMKGTIKVKDFFINNKVPRQKRPYVPLLQSGDQIIWVGGMRIGDCVKVTDTTQSILKASLLFDGT